VLTPAWGRRPGQKPGGVVVGHTRSSDRSTVAPSRVRFTLRVPPDSWMKRFRLTRVFPATAFPTEPITAVLLIPGRRCRPAPRSRGRDQSGSNSVIPGLVPGSHEPRSPNAPHRHERTVPPAWPGRRSRRTRTACSARLSRRSSRIPRTRLTGGNVRPAQPQGRSHSMSSGVGVRILVADVAESIDVWAERELPGSAGRVVLCGVLRRQSRSDRSRRRCRAAASQACGCGSASRHVEAVGGTLTRGDRRGGFVRGVSSCAGAHRWRRWNRRAS
jgi:hypothetical protein